MKRIYFSIYNYTSVFSYIFSGLSETPIFPIWLFIYNNLQLL